MSFCVACESHVSAEQRASTLEYWLGALCFDKETCSPFAHGAASAPPSCVTCVCHTCHKRLEKPYLVYLTNDRVNARLYRRPSLYFRKANQQRVMGLHAIDAIPDGTVLLYPGPLIDEHVLDNFYKRRGYGLTHAYAKGGPKGRGVRTVIFGHLTPPGNPYNAAHYINALKARDGSKARGARFNCTWGTVKVTPALKARHPDLAAQMRMGENYPAVRVTKFILPGEELILQSYGFGYWCRARKEACGAIRVTRRRFLTQIERELLFAQPSNTDSCIAKQKRDRYVKCKLNK